RSRNADGPDVPYDHHVRVHGVVDQSVRIAYGDRVPIRPGLWLRCSVRWGRRSNDPGGRLAEPWDNVLRRGGCDQFRRELYRAVGQRDDPRPGSGGADGAQYDQWLERDRGQLDEP